MENPESDSEFSDIFYSCQVSSKVPYELQKGQALITFEKEEGMTNVQKLDRVTFRKHWDFQRVFVDIGHCFRIFISFRLILTGVP